MIKNSLITILSDENHHFLIDNLASGDPSFGRTLHSRSFLNDTIDLIIASSVKDIKINHMPGFSLIALRRNKLPSREQYYTDRDFLITPT